MTITRSDLAALFDGAYERDEQGGRFSWLTPGAGAAAWRGLRRLEQLVFVRHAESEYQADIHGPKETRRMNRRYHDTPLTAKGRQQAAALAQRLRREKDGGYDQKKKKDGGKGKGGGGGAAGGAGVLHGLHAPELVISSPLTRCLETAALAYPAHFPTPRTPPPPGGAGAGR